VPISGTFIDKVKWQCVVCSGGVLWELPHSVAGERKKRGRARA